jgi:hydroxymethylpyrimidine/phosphomethylpyrimidine kinase
VTPPVVLTVAGSDSGGGAGIQADCKTIEAGGAFATTAITNVTAQNTQGVHGTHALPPADVRDQIEAVLDDFAVGAVKTGMLGTQALVETVTDYAEDLPALVVDPVMVAASGDRLLEPEAEAAYEDLLGAATLVTPNADEAEVLTGVTISDADTARRAGEALLDLGAHAALVKGGHVPGEAVVDTLVTQSSVQTFRHDRIDTDATHGSGCALSSAIATRLAYGDDVQTAVGKGISLLSKAVRYNVDVGDGPGAVHHMVDARNEAAREETVQAVKSVLTGLADERATALRPAGLTNVAGATPYAESPADVAAVEGGIGVTRNGLRTNRGVAFGVARGPAATLLAAREHDPGVRFTLVCSATSAVINALGALGGPVTTVDGADADERMAAAFEGHEQTPAAVVDRDSDRLTLLAPTAEALLEQARAVVATVEE